MSFLDLNQSDQAIARQPQPNEAHDLPATFGQTFDAAWSEGRLFGNSNAGENARSDALQDHIADIEKNTGKDLARKIDWSGQAFGGVMTADMLREQVNGEAKKIGQPELSADDLEQAAVAKSKAAQTAYADISAQEKTLGGKLGMFAGGAGVSGTDPVNLLALPVAPETEGISILSAALRWGAVAGASQAAIEAAGTPYREEVDPGYAQSGAPLTNVLEAAGGGMVLGGVTKALGNAWTRVKTGSWPTSVRDAGNVIESEANVANTNVYPGVEGEVAHRTALTKTIDDIMAEKPTDVSASITPAAEAGARGTPLPIEKAQRSAEAAQAQRAAVTGEAPELPFDATAAEATARASSDELASGVAQIAKRAGYDMPQEEAATIADRLTKATPEEAQDTLRDLQTSPRQVAEAPTRAPREPAELPREPVTDPVKAAEAPEHEQAMRADIDRERMTGDRQIPVDVDKDGNPVYRSLDGAMDEIDAYKKAADEIQTCAAPAPAAEEAA